MRRIVCFLFPTLCATTMLAAEGSLATLDGRKLEGALSPATGAFIIQPATGEAITVALTNLLLARFHTNEPVATTNGAATNTVSPAGVVLLNGAILDAPILSANDSSIRFQGMFAGKTISLTKVARIHLVPLKEEFTNALPPGRAGVLLKTRDFIDGEFVSIEGGRLKLGSVLFGNRTYHLEKEVVAIVLRGHGPPPWRYTITARDGTRLYGANLAVQPTRVAVTELAEFPIPSAELMEVARRSAER